MHTARGLDGDDAAELIGRVIEQRFEITEVLGAGAMGVVYGGIDHLLGRAVVVEVIAPSGPLDRSAGERLLREARLASRVHHPGVITVFHLGILETAEPFVVVERVFGRSLATVLAERGRLSIEQALAFLAPVASALEALHGAEIVHGDLAPEHVMVIGERTGLPSVKLVDFGLAILDDESRARLAAAGHLLGTAEYVAPEAIGGARPTPASDVYGLACLAFEMLTGRPPFEGAALDVLAAKMRSAAPRLSITGGDPLHAPLDGWIARALDRDPAARPRPAELVTAVRAAAAAAPRPASPAPAPRPSSRTSTQTAWIAWAGLGTGVLALLAAIAR